MFEISRQSTKSIPKNDLFENISFVSKAKMYAKKPPVAPRTEISQEIEAPLFTKRSVNIRLDQSNENR